MMVKYLHSSKVLMMAAYDPVVSNDIYKDSDWWALVI